MVGSWFPMNGLEASLSIIVIKSASKMGREKKKIFSQL